jgi:hypothetical protein
MRFRSCTQPSADALGSGEGRLRRRSRLLRRDVDHDALPAERLPVRTAHEDGLVVDPDDPAVSGDHSVLLAPWLAVLVRQVCKTIRRAPCGPDGGRTPTGRPRRACGVHLLGYVL